MKLSTSLVLPSMLDQLAKKFSHCSISCRAYRTKANQPVILHEYYQQSDRSLVARKFKYPCGSVFKDLIHNVAYTDCEAFVSRV